LLKGDIITLPPQGTAAQSNGLLKVLGPWKDNGAMTRGFAVIARPSEYQVTGVMAFQVDKTGILYEKDPGEKTADIVRSITNHDPDQFI
jgi:hypothetical protein